MKRISVLATAALVLILAGCSSRKTNLAEAEKKMADAEKQLHEAKNQANPEQRVAELEKELAAAKRAVAEAKGQDSSTPAEPPPPPKPKEYTVAAGTAIRARTTVALSTKTAATGSSFEASLVEPLAVDGVVLAPAGAAVTGVVALSDPGGRVKGRASIAVTLKSIATSSGPVSVQTDSVGVEAKSTVKKDAVRTGIMAGAGAAIGAIAGGGKGAAIGAGVGGGAGVATTMATRGGPAVIPAESALTFHLKSPLTLTAQP